MISEKNITYFREWLEGYVGTFYTLDEEYNKNIRLKFDHTFRVCGEIIEIGKSLGLYESRLNLAYMTALFHDVGRFDQFRHYRTFSDLNSEDHGRMGVRVLKETGLLDGLDEADRDTITAAVLHHNAAFLPAEISGDILLFIKMLRDADKIDILRIVTDNYDAEKGPRNPAIDLDLPEMHEISDEVYADLMGKKIVLITHCKSLNDFKMLQIGWVYDIYFPHSLETIKRRSYFEKIFRSLPATEKILEVKKQVMDFLGKGL